MGTQSITAVGRIDLPLLDYSKRRDVDLKECYLTLYDKFISYKVVATYESLDESTELWKPVKANYRWLRSRDTISDICMYYDNVEQMWSVGLEFAGTNTTNDWAFDNPKHALSVYEQLFDYMITR